MLVILAMVLSLVPVSVLAVDAAEAPGDDDGITDDNAFIEALGGSENAELEEWTGAITLKTDITSVGTHIRVKERYFTLDLNGHTLNMGSNSLTADENANLMITDNSKGGGGTITGSSNNGVVCAQNRASLTVDGIAIAGEKGASDAVGIVAGLSSTVDVNNTTISNVLNGVVVKDGAELNYNDGSSIESTGNGVTTIGTDSDDYRNPNIYINGGTIKAEGEDSVGLYLSAIGGVASIREGTIEGATGIEIRAGSLEISPWGDAVVITGGSGKPSTGTAPSGGGSVTRNAGIGIAPYADQWLQVTIRGGTISGSAALYQDFSSDGEGTEIDLSVVGGEFKGGSGSEGAGYGAVVVKKKDALCRQNFISGGTFSSDVSEFLEEGKDVLRQPDGTYIVVPKGADKRDEISSVAQVGSKYYDDFNNAIEAAQAGVGDTVILLNDAFSSQVEITEALSIDLNGKELYFEPGANTIFIDENGDLTIEDTSDGGGGKITNGESGLPVVQSGGVLTIDGATIENTSEECGTGIDIIKGGKLVVNGGSIQANGIGGVAIQSGGYWREGNETIIEIADSTIEAKQGRAIYQSLDNSTITIKGDKTQITGQVGILANAGKITVEGGTIEATGESKIAMGDPAYYDYYEIPPAGIVFDQNYNFIDKPKIEITGGTVKAAAGQSTIAYIIMGQSVVPAEDSLFNISEGAYFLSGEKGDTSIKKFLVEGLTVDETTGKVIKVGSSETEESYTITFDANDGTFPDGSKTQTAKTEKDGKLSKDVLSEVPRPTYDGHVFADWYREKEGKTQINDTYKFTMDTTVYAHWNVNDDDNGTGSGGTGGSGTGSGGTGGSGTGSGGTGGSGTGSGGSGTGSGGTGSGGTGGSGTGSGGTGGSGTGSGGTGGSGTGSGGTSDPSDEDTYTVLIDCGRHGTATADCTSAKQGTTVTITVHPESDYIVDSFRVERSSGGTVSWNQSGKRYTFKMPASDVTVDISFALRTEYNTFIPPQTQTQTQTSAQASLPASAFKPVTWRPAAAMWDVPANSWAYPAAQWAYQNGYLDTAADGTFRLNDTVSNLQMWRIMAQWLGEPVMDDSSVSRWASQSGAARVGTASGAMTRQNIVEYLYQCYFLMGGDVSVTGNLIQYRDGQQITSASAKNAWIWAVDKGIISGTPDGYLNPGGILSRGEFAAILMRLCQNGMR